MAVTSPNQWTLASTGTGDFEVLTGPTSGNWLIAVVSWSVNDGSNQTCTVADTATNMWQLLFSPTTAAFVTGQGGTNPTLGQTEIQNVQIWACPAAQYAGWPLCDVYVAFTKILAGDIGSVAINIFELAGMGNGTLTVDSVTLNTATSATSFSVAAPVPAVDCVMVAAAATDLNSATITFTAAGFTTLTQVSQNKVVNSGAGYFNPDLRLTAAWVETTLAQTATWTSSAACNWAGVIVAFRQTGIAPSQPNPNWPATQFQVGFGVQAGTPPSAVRWTDQTSRLLEWSHTRGVAYLLGNAQSEPTDLQIRNDDGAYTPRAPGSATANAGGSTTTLVCASTAVSGVNIGDFFQLKNSGGALKEYTVFQVQSVSTSGGTTTIGFVKADERAGGGGALVATVSGDIFAAIPIDLFIPYRILMTWQNKTYVVASGTLTDLPQLWINNHWGEVEGVAYDSLLFPAKVELDSILRTEIFRENPTHYWPLDDPQGSPVAQNIGSGSTQLVQTTSKFGAGSGTGNFGVSTQGLATSVAGQTTTIFGDGGTGWQTTGLTSAQINAKQGIAFVGSGNDFPSVTNGVTISGSLYVPSADQSAITGSTTDPTLVIIRSANPGGGSSTLLKVTINHTNLTSQVTVWDKVTRALTVTNGTNALLAQASWTSWAISFNQTHFYLYISGSLVASGTCNLGPTFNVIDLGGETDRFITGFCFGGIHAHVAIFPVMLSDLLQQNVAFSTTTSFSRSNDTLIRRLIEASGYVGPRVLTPSSINSTLPQQQSGNIIDQISAMVGYEDGLFFADSAGVFQFRSDTLSAFQTSSATLGENTAAGEFPYLPEWGQKKFPFDAVYVYDVTKISNTRELGGTTGTVTSSIIARNPAKFSKYGVLTLSKATLIPSDWQAWNLAWWLLWQYQQPKLRLESLTFEAVRTSAGSLWPFLLGAEVGDVVTVNRRPIGAPPISTICRVLKVEVHAVPPEEYTVKLTMGPVRPQMYVCNDPTLGVVGSGAPTGNVIGM